MKRIALIWAWAIAAVIVVWVGTVATGIEIGTGSLFVFFVVVLATCFAIDFVERRSADVRIVSGVVATGATISVWTGVEMANLDIESGIYILMFASTFAANWLALRRRERRAGRSSPSSHR